MSKIKYRFNTKSLSYEQVKRSWSFWLLRGLSYLATGSVFAAITVYIAFNFFDSPKEKQLKREIENLQLQYDLLNNRMAQVNEVLDNMQDRDDNIYRMIFEADPIPSTIRKAGFGGVDRYSKLEGFDNSKIIVDATATLDRLTKQLYIQSKSFDEVEKLVKNKEQLLASIPAIQPISNKDLKRVGSGYGWRTDPIYKTPEFHAGFDFTAVTGTEIYATGDGVVERADAMAQGYGNHVVLNHGYGYQTLYGHMSKIKVYVGQKVKRGEVIGYVGSTGKSTAPHVHYEVIKNGNKVSPINFFYNDLSPAEYEQLVELASRPSQSFD